MKINHKEVSEKIMLLSGVSMQDIKAVLEAIKTLMIMNHLEDKTIDIPYIGRLTITYHGDEYDKGTKRANISIDIDPDDSLVKNIGQAYDGDVLDIMKKYEDDLKDTLTNIAFN